MSKPFRRDPAETSGVDYGAAAEFDPLRGTQTAAPRKRTNREWDKNNPTKSYRLPDWVDREIDKLTRDAAGKRVLNKSEVTAFLLIYALDAVERGELELQPQRKPGRLTLFPDSE